MESLTQMLRRYQRKPEQALAARIVSELAGSEIYVPVQAAPNGQGVRPDTIPGPDSAVLFPAFSAQTQIANEYGARFAFLHLAFPAYAAACLEDPRCGGVVIDPFTAKFFLPPEVLRELAEGTETAR
ncbi:MAG: SseB family protein [Clostridiales bacterium]|nr:SseB family protein [Clostridiales bacterium]